MFEFIGNALGQIGNAVGSFLNPGVTGLLNFFTGERSYQQQNALNQQVMDREDSAYQRKVADLKKAGLSPALALGGGSPTSAMKVGGTPAAEDVGSKYLAYIMAKNQVSSTESQAVINAIQAQRAQLDYNIYYNTGVLPTDDWSKRALGLQMYKQGIDTNKVINNPLGAINQVQDYVSPMYKNVSKFLYQNF